jgi:hypothetical protein
MVAAKKCSLIFFDGKKCSLIELCTFLYFFPTWCHLVLSSCFFFLIIYVYWFNMPLGHFNTIFQREFLSFFKGSEIANHGNVYSNLQY